MNAHNIRAFALALGHGAVLVSMSQAGTRTIERMRQHQDAPQLVTNMHQTITWLSLAVALLLLAAFFAIADEVKPLQKALLGLSLAGFLVELAIACRIWLL